MAHEEPTPSVLAADPLADPPTPAAPPAAPPPKKGPRPRRLRPGEWRSAKTGKIEPRNHRPKKVLPPSGITALAHLEYKLGGRPGLIAALVLAPQNDDLDRFLMLAMDHPGSCVTGTHVPSEQNYRHFGKLCLLAGVFPRDVLKWVEQGQQAEAHALAKTEIYRQTPGIVGDVLRKAQPHEALCKDCAGRGHKFELERDAKDPAKVSLTKSPCSRCGGEGWIAREAVPADVTRALDLAGLVSKSPLVQQTHQQLNVVVGGSGQSLPQLQRAVDQILHGDAFAGEIPEAEEVEERDAPEVVEAEVRALPAPTLESPAPAALVLSPLAHEILL